MGSLDNHLIYCPVFRRLKVLCTLEWEDVSSKIAVLLYMVRSSFSGQHTVSCSDGGHPGSLVDLDLSQLVTFFEEVLESLSRCLFDGPLLGPNPRHRLVAWRYLDHSFSES